MAAALNGLNVRPPAAGAGAGDLAQAGDQARDHAPVVIRDNDRLVFYRNGVYIVGQNIFLSPEQTRDVSFLPGTLCQFVNGFFIGVLAV